MHRRSFLRFVERFAMIAAMGRWFDVSSLRVLAAQAESGIVHRGTSGHPQVAITMDDPRVALNPFLDWKEANQRILGALDSRKLKAALFVCGKRVDRPEGKNLC